ncbi:MAG: polymer-forming cytoskeletal protein [Lachnospiraceae bacterium]|nr:polymer-forming cytoskeletal protein [Lachnospiraceae bacterium]
MAERKGNLQIDGLSSSGGGDFEKVVLNGKGTITGDVSADVIDVNGGGTFQGKTVGKEISVAGTVGFKDDVTAEKFKVSGTARVDGTVTTETLKISGHTNISGNVKGDMVNIDGKVTIGGDCEVESFDCQGNIKIGGQLNAEKIKIEVLLKCEISEIVGSEIEVKRGKGNVMKVVDNIFPTVLIADSIEGDKIDLDFVNAKVVRGEDVKIGPNCEIDMVEYRGTYTQDPSAKVTATCKL